MVETADFLARALVEALGGDLKEMEEDEVRWARCEVVERCIYGVDLNFLDHHLCCGNSLIGARLEDIGLLPEIGKKGKPTAVTTLAGRRKQLEVKRTGSAKKNQGAAGFFISA